MWKTILRGFAIAVLIGGVVQAATLEDILAKNLAARGGADKLRAIQSIRIHGKAHMGEMEVPMVIMQKRPRNLRMELTIQNQTIVQAFDGKTAWWIMPLMNIMEPQEMPEAEAKRFKDQVDSDLDSPFLDYQKKGYKVELLGEDNLEGTPVYKVKLTRPNGRQLTYYLDKDSGIELKIETIQEQQGQTLTVETVLGDYQEVDGIVFPFSIQVSAGESMGMQMTVDRIEVNPELSDDLFRFKPPETKNAPPPQKN